MKRYAEQWIASIPTSSTYPIDASYEQYALPNKTYTKTIERKDTDDIATVMYGAFRRLDDDAIVRIKSNLIKSDLIDGIASDYITEKIQMRVREELGQAYYASASVSTHQNLIAPEQLFLISFPTKPTYAESLREEIATVLQGLLPISDTSLSEQKAIATSNIQRRFNEPDVMRTLYSLHWSTMMGLPLYVSEEDTLSTLDEISAKEIEERINNILAANNFSFVFLPSKEIGGYEQ